MIPNIRTNHCPHCKAQAGVINAQAGVINAQAEVMAALRADNALKIPREPTQAMLKAGDLAWSEGTLILSIWQAMYDAALQETSDD